MESVQSFERGLAVIRSFGAKAPRQTVAEVARSTNLSRASARRLLYTLENCGYVRRDGAQFALTPRMLGLGYAYLSSHPLSELAQPHLRQLSDRVHESTSVAVLDDTSVVYVTRVQANRLMTVSIDVGRRFAAYRTSLGRALLAWLPEEEVATVWERSDHAATTERSVTSLGELLAALEEVRRTGWAMVDQELEIGVRSVAAPIRNIRDEVTAAVNVSTHPSRTTKTDLRSTIVPALLETADEISEAMTAHRV